MTDYTFAGYKLNATSHKGDRYEYKDGNVSVWLTLDHEYSSDDGLFASAAMKVNGKIFTSKRGDGGCVASYS